jgi:hypothetical protein
VFNAAIWRRRGGGGAAQADLRSHTQALGTIMMNKKMMMMTREGSRNKVNKWTYGAAKIIIAVE